MAVSALEGIFPGACAAFLNGEHTSIEGLRRWCLLPEDNAQHRNHHIYSKEIVGIWGRH